MANECCELCKRRYAIVYRVPDDLWAQIAPRKDTLGPYPEHQGGGLLCPDCATVEAERIGVVLHFDARSDWSTDHSDLRAEIERLSDLLATTQRELAEANERWDHFQKLASDHRDELERELAEARAEAERWAAQALKEEECRIGWQADRDRLAAELERRVAGDTPRFVYSSVTPVFKKDGTDEIDYLECWLHTTIKGDDQSELYERAKSITDRVNASIGKEER